MRNRRLHSKRLGGRLPEVFRRSKAAKGFTALTTMAVLGLVVGLVVGGGPAGADVTSVSGRAWGNSRTVGLLGNPPAIPLPPGLLSFGPRPDTGPLPPNGGALSATQPTESGLGYSTGAQTVATAGGNVPGPLGFSESTANIAGVDVEGGTIVAGVLLPAPPAFAAANVQATCRSDAFNQSLTGPGGGPQVTITGGLIQNATGTGTNPVPAAPAPNTVLTGGNAGEIQVTLNEQTRSNAPGSTSVVINAVHVRRVILAPNVLNPLLPPVPVISDEIIIGHVECGAQGPNVNTPTNMRVEKAFQPANVGPGGTSNAVITVRPSSNPAGQTATTVVDDFDPRLTVGTIAPQNGFTCTTAPAPVTPTTPAGTTRVTCTRATAIGPGDTPPTITIPVTVNAGVNNASIPNTACITATTPAPPAPGAPAIALPICSAVANLVVGQPADPGFTVAKTFNPSTVAGPGSTSTATINVTRTGGTTTGNTVVTDTFDNRLTPAPTGATGPTGTNGFACSTAGQTVTCTRTTPMNANDTATISIPVTVNAGVTNATIPNTASVSNGTVNATSNVANLTVGTPQGANGTITKVFNPGTLPAGGGTSTAVVTVTNNTNTATAGNTVVTDTLDPRLTFVQAGSGGDAFACTAVGQAVTCTRTTSIPANGTATINIPVTAAAAANGATIPNTACVTFPGAAQVCSAPANLIVGQGGVVPPVVPGNQNADLSAIKRPGTNFVQNSQAMWIGVISNAGPAPSQPNVSFGDTLPTGTTFQSGGGGGFACTAAGQQVTCTRAAPLAAGETAVVQIIVLVTAPPGTALTNTIIVNGGAFDPVLSNNTASDTQVVQGPGTAVFYYQYPYGYAYPYAQQPCASGSGQQQQQQQTANAGGGTATQSGQQQQGGGGWGVHNQSQDQESEYTDKDGKTTKQSSDSSQHSVTGPPGMFGGGYGACPSGGGNQQQQQQ